MRTGQRLPPVAEGFHATVHDIPGNLVLPSREHGKQVFSISSSQDTYFTPIPHPDNPPYVQPADGPNHRFKDNGQGGLANERTTRAGAEIGRASCRERVSSPV